MALGTVKTPTPAQLAGLAAELGFHMSEADLAAYREGLLPSIDAYNTVDRMRRSCRR